MPANISRIELIRKFRTLGYLGPFSGKRHQFMMRGRQKIRDPNPHGSGDIHVSLVKEILGQAGITHEEWDNA